MSEPDLETERLRIRRLEIQDVEACHQLYVDIGSADDSLNETENRAVRRSLVEWSVQNYVQLERLRQPPYGDRALVAKDSGIFVGMVGFAPTIVPLDQLPSFGAQEHARSAPEVGLFWAVAPASQGKGYATEAAAAMLEFAFGALGSSGLLQRRREQTWRQSALCVGLE